MWNRWNWTGATSEPGGMLSQKDFDRFLVFEAFLYSSVRIKTSVGEGGCSDHWAIVLQWSSGSETPSSPLKISQVWFEEEDFKNMVESRWKKLSPSVQIPLMAQFAANLSRVKKAIKKWLPLWKNRRQKELHDDLKASYQNYSEI